MVLADLEFPGQSGVYPDTARSRHIRSSHCSVRSCCRLREGSGIQPLTGTLVGRVRRGKNLVRSLVGRQRCRCRARQCIVQAGGHCQVWAGQNADDPRELPAPCNYPQRPVRKTGNFIYSRCIEIVTAIEFAIPTVRLPALSEPSSIILDGVDISIIDAMRPGVVPLNGYSTAAAALDGKHKRIITARAAVVGDDNVG